MTDNFKGTETIWTQDMTDLSPEEKAEHKKRIREDMIALIDRSMENEWPCSLLGLVPDQSGIMMINAGTSPMLRLLFAKALIQKEQDDEA